MSDQNKFERLKDWENGNVKYALEGNRNPTEYVTATLVQGDLSDEMEIRVTVNNDRFEIRGHKTIMDNMTYEDFESKVRLHLERHEWLKEIKN